MKKLEARSETLEGKIPRSQEAKKPRSREAEIKLKYFLLFLCFSTSLLLCFSVFLSRDAHASTVDDARNLIMSGQLETGAQMLAKEEQSHPSPEGLLLLGQTLDRLVDLFSERVEMACYWGHAREATPSCAQAQADKLNAIYGAGAFKFVTDIAYVPYTGIHYRQIMNKFSGSKEAGEAEFQLLLKNLIGPPKEVLDRVRDFLNHHKSGETNRKALLLWARVNKDMWYIHHAWSWVIYNQKYSPAELTAKAEPYRKEAIKTFEELISKHSGTFEAGAAQQELSLIKANQYDSEVYSILQDTVGGSPDKWGSKIPKPSLKATQRGYGEPGWKKPTTPVAPTETGAPSYSAPQTAPTPPAASEPAGKSKKVAPKRWQ